MVQNLRAQVLRGYRLINTVFFACLILLGETLHAQKKQAQTGADKRTDSTLIVFYNELNENNELVHTINWEYQMPCKIVPDTETYGLMAIVNIKDSLNRFSVYYASEDVFDVKFTGDTLAISRLSDTGFYGTLYTLHRFYKRGEECISVRMTCYGRYSTETVNLLYKQQKGNWIRLDYKRSEKKNQGVEE